MEKTFQVTRAQLEKWLCEIAPSAKIVWGEEKKEKKEEINAPVLVILLTFSAIIVSILVATALNVIFFYK